MNPEQRAWGGSNMEEEPSLAEISSELRHKLMDAKDALYRSQKKEFELKFDLERMSKSGADITKTKEDLESLATVIKDQEEVVAKLKQDLDKAEKDFEEFLKK